METTIAYLIAVLGMLGLLTEAFKRFLDRLPGVIDSWHKTQRAWRRAKDNQDSKKIDGD